jgi:hypothetical protein
LWPLCCLSVSSFFLWPLCCLAFSSFSCGHCVVCTLVLFSCGHCVVCPLVLFSCGHCVSCPSIDGFWLPFWYLQTFLTDYWPSERIYYHTIHILCLLEICGVTKQIMSTFTSVNILKRKTPIKNTTVLSCHLRKSKDTKSRWGRRGRDRMVVGFTTTYAISAYHHWCCEF